MKITEKQFLNTVRDTALAAGWLFYHTHDSRRSDVGFPDCVFLKNGHLYFAELKSETGKVTKAQMRWLNEINKLNLPQIRAWILRPSEFEMLWRELKRVK